MVNFPFSNRGWNSPFLPKASKSYCNKTIRQSGEHTTQTPNHMHPMYFNAIIPGLFIFWLTRWRKIPPLWKTPLGISDPFSFLHRQFYIYEELRYYVLNLFPTAYFLPWLPWGGGTHPPMEKPLRSV